MRPFDIASDTFFQTLDQQSPKTNSLFINKECAVLLIVTSVMSSKLEAAQIRPHTDMYILNGADTGSTLTL
jgi:hypothetical protein